MIEAVDWAGAWGLRLLAGIFNAFPLRAALAVGRFGGRIAFYFFSRRRNEAYADLKAALDLSLSEKERWNILHRLFEHFGQMFVEVLRSSVFDEAEVNRYVQVHHWERCEPAPERKRGLIFLTAHLGNWELMQLVSGNLGQPIHVLAQKQKHPRMDQYLNQLRQSRGKTVSISQGMGIRGLLKVLQNKGVIGLLGDRSAGKHEGLILPFLGRKATIPVGAFEMARRTGSLLVPCFFIRRKGHFYDFHTEEPIDCGSPEDQDLTVPVTRYVRLLEDVIRKYPEQWLWFGKRWKYTWTKRLLILSDGKPGHEKQSEAIASHFRSVQMQYDRPGMEYLVETIQVRFRSPWHKKLFSLVSLVYIPFAQGRLRFLKTFLEPSSYEKIAMASADFVISAGSGLVPVNLCLVRDFGAKSVVLMKPSFPFNWFRYDLAVIPAHDQGVVPRHSLRPLLAPNTMDAAKLGQDAEKLKSTLRDPSRIKISVFLGGDTRNFTMAISSLEYLFAELQRVSKKNGDYLITTSRRTPDTVVDYFRDRVLQDPSCQMFVAAKEDARSEVVGGMMALAEILVVTEDSISMISEAISTGKKVIVLTFRTTSLPKKHQRFQQLLKDRSVVTVSEPEHLEEAIKQLCGSVDSHFVESEIEMLRKRLQEML
ncbi:MAG: hypothetical protein EXS63_06535 [Candidatus Omnitrophica bacterium]|nr:hypothetical protein [Candidatus Omnitrophota bacterium]